VARKKEAEHKALLLEEGPVSTTAMKAIEEGKKRVQLETEQQAAAKAELRAANTRKAQGERFAREAAERAETERVLAARAMQPN
jgi:hypothetical protein